MSAGAETCRSGFAGSVGCFAQKPDFHPQLCGRAARPSRSRSPTTAPAFRELLLPAGSRKPRQRQEADLRVAEFLVAMVSLLALRWRPGVGHLQTSERQKVRHANDRLEITAAIGRRPLEGVDPPKRPLKGRRRLLTPGAGFGLAPSRRARSRSGSPKQLRLIQTIRCRSPAPNPDPGSTPAAQSHDGQRAPGSRPRLHRDMLSRPRRPEDRGASFG